MNGNFTRRKDTSSGGTQTLVDIDGVANVRTTEREEVSGGGGDLQHREDRRRELREHSKRRRRRMNDQVERSKDAKETVDESQKRRTKEANFDGTFRQRATMEQRHDEERDGADSDSLTSEATASSASSAGTNPYLDFLMGKYFPSSSSSSSSCSETADSDIDKRVQRRRRRHRQLKNAAQKHEDDDKVGRPARRHRRHRPSCDRWEGSGCGGVRASKCCETAVTSNPDGSRPAQSPSPQPFGVSSSLTPLGGQRSISEVGPSQNGFERDSERPQDRSPPPHTPPIAPIGASSIWYDRLRSAASRASYKASSPSPLVTPHPSVGRKEPMRQGEPSSVRGGDDYIETMGISGMISPLLAQWRKMQGERGESQEARDASNEHRTFRGQDQSFDSEAADMELTRRARDIQEQIRLAEMEELAVEAERAADAGQEKFVGTPSTFGADPLRRPSPSSDGDSTPSPESQSTLCLTPKPLNDGSVDVSDGDKVFRTPLSNGHPVGGEDIPFTPLLFRRDQPEMERSPSVVGESAGLMSPMTPSSVHSTVESSPRRSTVAPMLPRPSRIMNRISSAPAHLQHQFRTGLISPMSPTSPSSVKKIRVLALRHVSEVIPSFQEMHTHLRTHFARNRVEQSVLLGTQSAAVLEKSQEGNFDGSDCNSDNRAESQMKRSESMGSIAAASWKQFVDAVSKSSANSNDNEGVSSPGSNQNFSQVSSMATWSFSVAMDSDHDKAKIENSMDSENKNFNFTRSESPSNLYVSTLLPEHCTPPMRASHRPVSMSKKKAPPRLMLPSTHLTPKMKGARSPANFSLSPRSDDDSSTANISLFDPITAPPESAVFKLKRRLGAPHSNGKTVTENSGNKAPAASQVRADNESLSGRYSMDLDQDHSKEMAGSKLALSNLKSESGKRVIQTRTSLFVSADGQTPPIRFELHQKTGTPVENENFSEEESKPKNEASSHESECGTDMQSDEMVPSKPTAPEQNHVEGAATSSSNMEAEMKVEARQEQMPPVRIRSVHAGVPDEESGGDQHASLAEDGATACIFPSQMRKISREPRMPTLQHMPILESLPDMAKVSGNEREWVNVSNASIRIKSHAVPTEELDHSAATLRKPVRTTKKNSHPGVNSVTSKGTRQRLSLQVTPLERGEGGEVRSKTDEIHELSFPIQNLSQRCRDSEPPRRMPRPSGLCELTQKNLLYAQNFSRDTSECEQLVQHTKSFPIESFKRDEIFFPPTTRQSGFSAPLSRSCSWPLLYESDLRSLCHYSHTNILSTWKPELQRSDSDSSNELMERRSNDSLWFKLQREAEERSSPALQVDVPQFHSSHAMDSLASGPQWSETNGNMTVEEGVNRKGEAFFPSGDGKLQEEQLCPPDDFGSSLACFASNLEVDLSLDHLASHDGGHDESASIDVSGRQIREEEKTNSSILSGAKTADQSNDQDRDDQSNSSFSAALRPVTSFFRQLREKKYQFGPRGKENVSLVPNNQEDVAFVSNFLYHSHRQDLKEKSKSQHSTLEIEKDMLCQLPGDPQCTETYIFGPCASFSSALDAAKSIFPKDRSRRPSFTVAVSGRTSPSLERTWVSGAIEKMNSAEESSNFKHERVRGCVFRAPTLTARAYSKGDSKQIIVTETVDGGKTRNEHDYVGPVKVNAGTDAYALQR